MFYYTSAHLNPPTSYLRFVQDLSYCTVACQLARFQLTRRIARSVTCRGLVLLNRSGSEKAHFTSTANAASLSLIVGTSTVPVVALRSSGSSALCRARFPMMDRELCRAMGCRMREDDTCTCTALLKILLASAHFAGFGWEMLTFGSLAGKGSLSLYRKGSLY